MEQRVQKLSIREKLGYSLGDSAANFVFQMMIFYQLYYYTDILGVSSKAAGILLLVARVWDAVFDPFMGIIADKTRSRWGKFRPWILWTSLPFGVLFFLTFMAPEIEGGGKLLYAYFTYILLMMVYSANNLPYSSLGGVMTGDMVERTGLASYRQVAAMGAAFIIQGFFMSMVDKFGQGDKALGFRVTVGIFAAIAVVFHLITFITTRERIIPNKEQESTVKEAFTDLTRNGPWIAIFVATLFIFTNLSMRGSVLYYYFNYYLDANSIQNFMEQIGYNPETLEISRTKAFELFNMTGMGIQIIGILLSKPLAARFGKRSVFIFGLSFATFFTVLFGFVPDNTTVLTFIVNMLLTISFGITIPLLWAMFGDVADYSEWKFNRRATGVVFAAVVFALKFGLGFGGAIGGFVLDFYGYDPANITPKAIEGVRLTASIYPAIMFAVAVIFLIRYKIDKKLEFQIQNELEARASKR
jgi:Na+/melibiose symporter-like transporter